MINLSPGSTYLIEAMFHQVWVSQKDQIALRFLWRGPNRNRPLDVYQMQSTIFGAKPSPCSASYCLRKTATDNQDDYDRATVETVLRDFYMDDLLKSVPSDDKAARLALQLIDLLSRGGFRLTKFMNSSKDVLAKVPSENKVNPSINLDLDDLPVEKVLGVLWDAERDTLEIKSVVKALVPTKRNILSQVSTIFDPLGLVAPFVMRAKLILQQLWRQLGTNQFPGNC